MKTITQKKKIAFMIAFLILTAGSASIIMVANSQPEASPDIEVRNTNILMHMSTAAGVDVEGGIFTAILDHEYWMALTAFQIGGVGGDRLGSLTEFLVIKLMDDASPVIFDLFFSHQEIATVKIHVMGQGNAGNLVIFYKYELTGVYITSYTQTIQEKIVDGAPHGIESLETISFSYGTIYMESSDGAVFSEIITR